MSSRTDDWQTPLRFFNALHSRHRFTIDAAADCLNRMLPRFFDKQANGLLQSWTHERVWLNPPYGREIGLWAAKAAQSGTFVVMLVPARTDTRWWHDSVIAHATRIGFVRGRLKFNGGPHSAPFPSAIVEYDPQGRRRPPFVLNQQGMEIGPHGKLEKTKR